MPLRDLLATYYAIQTEDKLTIDGREGYLMDEYVYFTISSDNKEIIHMEQAALAYYLAENQYTHIAVPIPNIHGEWYTAYQSKKYLVVQVQLLQLDDSHISSGALLAEFHQTGTAYAYEPQAISSYGSWRQLWIEKLTAFENKIEEEAKEHPSSYYRLLMDVLPYIIGISENAIQYVQESERDNRFHESDQGTVAFRRYANNLVRPVVWMEDLVYDHPARDLAEHIRWLIQSDVSQEEAVAFLEDYRFIRQLSVFSWRLLYARLVFPVHLFDFIERAFSRKDFEQMHMELIDLLDKQADYEEKLRVFFQVLDVGRESQQIPVLHWL
ncbi:protein kinase family protein [Virgibacillus ainsalahensis]